VDNRDDNFCKITIIDYKDKGLVPLNVKTNKPPRNKIFSVGACNYIYRPG